MAIEDAEEIITKLKDEIKAASNPAEASQWAKCLQSFVTANAIHHDLKLKLNS